MGPPMLDTAVWCKMGQLQERTWQRFHFWYCDTLTSLEDAVGVLFDWRHQEPLDSQSESKDHKSTSTSQPALALPCSCFDVNPEACSIVYAT